MSEPSPQQLFGITAPCREWLLLFLCIGLAGALAFLPGAEGGRWGIQYLGYGQMLLLIAAAGWYGVRHLRERGPVWLRWWRRGGCRALAAPVLLVAAASVFAHVHFPHRLKVLTDEASLVATSLAIQQHRIVYTPNAAEGRDGVFVTGFGYINKRPYLHPVLVSLVNDFTGYRWSNGIVLNAVLTPPTMLLFFLIGRLLWRRHGGGLSLALASGVPIIEQTMTGGGLEVLNLLLLLAATYAGLCLWARPSRALLGFFVIAACLLGHVRYESGLYLVPAGLLVLVVLRRWRCGRIPPVLGAVAIFCVPLVWLQLVAFACEKEYFQLAARDDASAFSLTYLPGNLRSAFEYFIVPDPVRLSAPLLFGLGTVGAVVLAGAFLRRRLSGVAGRQAWVLAGVAAATMANAFLFLAFNYGQYGEYITQRISLPIWAVAVLLAVWSAGRVRSGWWPKLVVAVAAANLCWFHLPVVGANHFESQYAYGKDFAFVAEYVAGLPSAQGLKVVSHVPVFWLVQRCPAIDAAQAERSRDTLFQELRTAQVDRLLVHYFEYSPHYRLPNPVPGRPPEWFGTARKRLVARRWLGSGTWSVIYEAWPSEEGAIHTAEPPSTVMVR